MQFDCCGQAIAWHVFDGDRAVFVQRGSHDTYWRFDAMVSGLNAAQPGERHHQADGSVPTHSQASAVVEENYAGDTLWVDGFTEQRPHHHLRTVWFRDQGSTEGVVLLLKAEPSLLQAALA